MRIEYISHGATAWASIKCACGRVFYNLAHQALAGNHVRCPTCLTSGIPHK